jgi:hypothetical protein
VTKIPVEINDALLRSLCENLYSYEDAAKLLGLKRSYSYYVIRKSGVEPIMISGVRHLTAEQIEVVRQMAQVLKNHGKKVPDD